MDRRTVLAFVLIFLIIMGWSALMKRLYPQPEGSAAGRVVPDSLQVDEVPAAGLSNAETEREPSQSGDFRDRRDREGEGETWQDTARRNGRAALDEALEPLDQDGEASTVEVVTPLYRAEISTRGARIVSWQLADYDLHSGAPVDLIPSGGHGTRHGADQVVFEDGILPLGDLLFSIEGPNRVVLEDHSDERTVSLAVRTAGGLVVRKEFVFRAASYGVTTRMSVGGQESASTSSAGSGVGRPERAIFGWNQGIAATERNQRTSGPAFRAFARVGDQLHFERRRGLSKGAEKVAAAYNGSVFFAGVQNKYFTIAGIVPPTDGGVSEGRVELGGDQERMEQTWSIDLPLRRASAAGEFGSAVIEVYLGPQETDLLKAYQVGLEDTMELGWALFRPLAQAVLWIMKQMARAISNYGVIIIIFSVLTKLAFYPLTRKSTESMKRMQELQPKIKALQEKYKDDREKQSQAMMKLYKEEKINPMAGCLPLVIQMPVFVALYQSLMHTIALRQKPFVLWIDDLSQPDALFNLPVALPFLGSDFNLLPVLMAVAMWIQTKLSPTGAAGGQMAVMNSILPVMMLVFFYQMPSGLVIYWLVNTIMTIYQTWRIHKTASPQGSVKQA